MKSIFHRATSIKMINIGTFRLLLFCVTVIFSLNTAYPNAGYDAGDHYIFCDTTNKRLIIKYHPNGKIMEKGYQGYYSNQVISTGTFIGAWNRYDDRGHLSQSTYYYNDLPEKAFIEKKKYYPNGRLKSIEKFNNYELYESETDSIGTWKYFDNKGKLIKKIRHKR